MFRLHLSDQVLLAANSVPTSFEDPEPVRALQTPDEVNAALTRRGITWEFMAYVLLWHTSRICPATRSSVAVEMSLRDPLHGLLYWFIVEHFFGWLIINGKINIPGMSTTNATAPESSQCDKVLAIAVAKQQEMVNACVKAGVIVPNLNDWFFQKTEGSSDEERSDGDIGLSGSEESGDEASERE